MANEGFETATAPLARVRELLAEALKAESADATAMALATADAAGRPSVRMVLLKSAGDDGFTFYTNLGSRKARELAVNPHAALCIHWPALGYQVRAEGPVQPVSAAEADAYFASRPRGSQLGAWASRQSDVLESREALLGRYRDFETRYPDAVPRPSFWSGFRLAPVTVEFWRTDTHRLHYRTLYRVISAGWARELLYP